MTSCKTISAPAPLRPSLSPEQEAQLHEALARERSVGAAEPASGERQTPEPALT